MTTVANHPGFFERQLDQNECDKTAVGQALLKHDLFKSEDTPAKSKDALIRSKDAVILDAGSSATYVADAIFKRKNSTEPPPQDTTRPNSKEATDLSILTHNYAVFESVVEGSSGEQERGQHELLITGGCYDPIYNALYGKLTESSYEAFHPTVVVLAISGLLAGRGTTPGGVFCHAAIETSIKELLFRKRTGRRIIIADYTKIGRADSHRVGDLSELSEEADEVYLVTTRRPRRYERKAKYDETMESLSELHQLGIVELDLNRGARLVSQYTISVPEPSGGRPRKQTIKDGWQIGPRDRDSSNLVRRGSA